MPQQVKITIACPRGYEYEDWSVEETRRYFRDLLEEELTEPSVVTKEVAEHIPHNPRTDALRFGKPLARIASVGSSSSGTKL